MFLIQALYEKDTSLDFRFFLSDVSAQICKLKADNFKDFK